MDSSLAGLPFDELLHEVLGRVKGVLDEQERWRLLLDAVVIVGADLSLDGVLARIVEVACGLVGAQYAALGVLGFGPERRLRTFIHHGMTTSQVHEIGDLPTGLGLLGQIIDRPEPLRLHDIAEHPASHGFPENHPPMSSFLGVPVRIRDRVFGNLYLTEKAGGGDFTEQDERIAVALASAAGVAIENARLYEEAARRERWLAATAEITGLLSGSATGEQALQAVTDRAREVSDADVAWIVAGDDDEHLSVQVVSGARVDMESLAAISLDASLAREVVRTGLPISVEHLPSDARSAAADTLDGWSELGPAIIVPLRNAAGVAGALALAWQLRNVDRFHAVDPALPASFAEQAALALQVSRAREDQQRLAVLEDRDRIGRDLHDLVIQRLFAVGLSLQGASRLAERPDVTGRLNTAVDDLDDTIRDIRRSIFALGSFHDAADIQAEVTRMVDRAATTLKFRPSLRFDGPVRTRIGSSVAPDILAVLGEVLSNVARHARASTVTVVLSAGEEISLVVTDDGQGLPKAVDESGLRNIRQRAEGHGGHCEVRSSAQDGTRVQWTIPAP